MAKYLSRLGWQVTIVTPTPSEEIKIDMLTAANAACEKEDIRRIFAGKLIWRPHGSPFRQPIAWLRYLPFALFRHLLNPFGIGLDELWPISCIRTKNSLKKGKYDIVLATGSPFSTFLAARHVATRLEIPYVLDYRDPWSLSAHRTKPKSLDSIIRPLECRLLRDAAATLMVSSSQAKNQFETFQMVKPPTVITNGYDPEQFDVLTPMVFQNLAVVYTGSFYKGQREIDPILKAVKMATESQGKDESNIRLHYFGNDVQNVMKQAKQYGAEDLVICHGLVSREQALAAVKGAGVAVVITSIHERANLAERGIITGKIFEPLGMGVPILLVAPDGSDATAIVEKTSAGRSFRASQVKDMAQWLLELASTQLLVRYLPPKEYSWPMLAHNLDEKLQAIHKANTRN